MIGYRDLLSPPTLTEPATATIMDRSNTLGTRVDDLMKPLSLPKNMGLRETEEVRFPFASSKGMFVDN